MPATRYVALQKKIITITLIVSFAPLILLGATIYYQFDRMYRAKIEEQIRYRAQAQADAVDLFLKERTAILSAMADTHSFEEMVEESTLSEIFKVMNLRAGAFVDLGVIDSVGVHRAYVGPYELKGLNYYHQPWFGQVMNKGVYISDVYLGFRQLPHFIIAVRRQEGQRSWILRATIDPDIFGGIVRAARVGRTGDAFIVNREGVYQTRTRYGEPILSQSNLDTTQFGRTTTVLELETTQGRERLHAGSWIESNNWLLVISQDAGEEMEGLFATRNVEIAIILSGILAIVFTTIFTTRLAVGGLREADLRMGELNAQLVESDKLAALGKMAAGVAHEINNPLAVIIQITGWIKDLLTEEDIEGSKNFEEYRKSVGKIEEHVERIRKVVHGMLGYARRMEPRLDDVDVNETVKQTVALLENYARINNIEIQTDLPPDLPIIASDQAQLQQVFLNLISNAIDALGRDGWIHIKTKRTDGRIAVSITDNGPGIPKDQQRKVFDPFFTTTEAGKGTGLGLWVSYNIVEKMGGTIMLSSEVGQGSTFTVYIPVVVPAKK
jgi:two-component system NtrC family sensor kinase